MNYRETLKGKKVLVVGLGKSGKAAVEALVELGAYVSGQDNSPADKLNTQLIRFMENNHINMYLGCMPDDMASFDMLVLSPGVPPTLDFIEAARKAGVEIIGELELAYRITEGKYVAITGTNGKTTTTTLVGEIFAASGRRTAVVGNIGNPVVTEAIDSSEDEWMVAEVSSFQLETTREFHPVVSAILNLTPDHLNRHKTMEAYGAAKAAVFANQTAEDYLVINYDDKTCMALADDCKARIVPFSRLEKPDFGAYLDGDELVINNGTEVLHICDKHELRIIGNHNIENALASAAVSYFAGIDINAIRETIVNFAGVEHRIEFCGELDGALYYNDSKGTNVDASVIAIKALENNIILIAGGDGKSQDFTDLAEHLNGAVKALVLLGRDARNIEEAARKAGFTAIYNEKNMTDVVARCHKIAEKGDKVLLSPACASWDMYANYEQRGNHFKKCVEDLLR